MWAWPPRRPPPPGTGVAVTPIRGASAKGRSFTFPITGGRVDGTTVGKAHIAKGENRVVVSNVRASLTGTAAALNKTFHVTLLKKGLNIGVAKVTARI